MASRNFFGSCCRSASSEMSSGPLSASSASTSIAFSPYLDLRVSIGNHSTALVGFSRGSGFGIRRFDPSRSHPYGVQQTEYGHVAERKVRGKQQGSIYPRRRAPRRKRVYAKCRRTSEEDLNPVAVRVTGWRHAAP